MLTLRSIRETGSQRWLLAALTFAGFGSFLELTFRAGSNCGVLQKMVI